MPRLMAAAAAALMLALSLAPAHSAETASTDDTARFLAGLPPSANSPLVALTKDPSWQQHARYFDSIFAREDSAKLSKVRAFSKEYLTDKHETMLYMFSGPDFLYATSFFPGASTYVLAGLEPIGDIPSLTSLSRGTVNGSLRNLESSMGSLLSYSFFITHNMRTQLQEGPIHGTLPVLFVFLARTGKTVHEVSFVALNPDGSFQDASDAANADAKKSARNLARSAAPAVKIVFSDGAGPKQTLYYFSTNLADGSIDRSGFLPFVQKLAPADSFIKSASYLLHSGGFNKVRSLLLDRSATVLQDDSGIPLAYFDQKKWHLRPFGRYVGPLSIFGHSYQPGMAELFRHATPIDFGIGYRWRHNESNLLLAQRAAPVTSEQELTTGSPSDRYSQGDESQASKKARKTSRSAQTHRKRAEGDSINAFGCRLGAIFSFCSDNPARASR